MNIIVKKKNLRHKVYKIFFKLNYKAKLIGSCKVDASFNHFFFINYKKLYNFFYRYRKLKFKIRLSLRFSLFKLKMFIGFIKIVICYLKFFK